MKKAFTIIRVSGEDQLKGYGPDVQWEYDIVPMAPELDLEVSEYYRRTLQESAIGWDRAKWEAAVREALAIFNKGEIQALMFPRVDRETRFVAGSFPLLVEIIRAGLEVYFGREKFRLDLNDSESVEKYMNKAVQAQQYAETTTQNTMRGKHISASKGNLPQGTGRGLYGYKWDKEAKKRVSIEFESRVVNKIFTMLADGKTRHEVAITMNRQAIPSKTGGMWHARTIENLATNTAYIGLTYWGKTRGSQKTKQLRQPRKDWVALPEITPPIISEELFDYVQTELQKTKDLRKGRKQNDYLLIRHIVCGHCGSSLVGHCLNHKYRYYQCRGASATYTRERICDARYVRADPLETLVWGKIRGILQYPQVIMAEFRRQTDEQRNVLGDAHLDQDIAKLQRRIKGYANAEISLIALHEEVTRDYVLDEVNRLKHDREADERQLTEFRKTKQQLTRLNEAEINLSEFHNRVHKNLINCTFDDKRLALKMLDIRVTVTCDQVEITGTIPIDITTTSSSQGLPTIEQTSA